MKIVISQATPELAETVIRIGRETFYATWKHANTEQDLQDYMAMAFDPGKVKGELEQDSIHTFFLAEVDGGVVGYSKLRRDTVFVELEGENVIEIERLYVSQRYHGTGVAQALMESMISLSRHEGKTWVCLGVDINNHRAIRFYSRYGFEVFGQKTFWVGQAADIDQLMKLKLTAV